MSVLERLPEGARVLVIRLRSLGDCVLTTPALALLHGFRPDLRIGVAVEPVFRPVFTGNPSVTGMIDGRPAAAFAFRPDLTLNLHGGGRSLWMTAASLAGVRAGFAHHTGSWSYSHPIPRAQEILGVSRKVHTAEHLASAMFHLGVPPTPVPRAQLFAASPRQGQYAVIHPFASTPAKTWPADRFTAVAAALARECGLEPIFIGSAGDDFTPFAGFRCERSSSLDETKNLLAGAHWFLGNDSGPAHMAAAFGLPVTVIFGPSDADVWSPWRTEHEVLQGGAQASNVPLDAVLQTLSRWRVRA